MTEPLVIDMRRLAHFVILAVVTMREALLL